MIQRLPEIELRPHFTNEAGGLLYPDEPPSIYLPVKGREGLQMVEATRVGTDQIQAVLRVLKIRKEQRIKILHALNQGKAFFGTDPDNTATVLRETGEPYHYHLRAVALILIYELGIFDPAQIMAALVHDFVEDAKALKKLTAENSEFTPVEFLAVIYNSVAADIVRAQTKPKRLTPKHLMKPDEVRRHKEATYRQLLVVNAKGNTVEKNLTGKLADRVHNLRTAISDEMRIKKTIETLQYFVPLIREYLGDKGLTFLMDALERHMGLLTEEQRNVREFNYFANCAKFSDAVCSALPVKNGPYSQAGENNIVPGFGDLCLA